MHVGVKCRIRELLQFWCIKCRIPVFVAILVYQVSNSWFHFCCINCGIRAQNDKISILVYQMSNSCFCWCIKCRIRVFCCNCDVSSVEFVIFHFWCINCRIRVFVAFSVYQLSIITVSVLVNFPLVTIHVFVESKYTNK